MVFIRLERNNYNDTNHLRVKSSEDDFFPSFYDAHKYNSPNKHISTLNKIVTIAKICEICICCKLSAVVYNRNTI